MNQELITLNEVFNEGHTIYFYKAETTGTWVTYGYSAYLLAHLDKVNHLAGFSCQMQMPCVSVSEADFKKLLSENRDRFATKDGSYLCGVDICVDEEKYQLWVNNLK